MTEGKTQQSFMSQYMKGLVLPYIFVAACAFLALVVQPIWFPDSQATPVETMAMGALLSSALFLYAIGEFIFGALFGEKDLKSGFALALGITTTFSVVVIVAGGYFKAFEMMIEIFS